MLRFILVTIFVLVPVGCSPSGRQTSGFSELGDGKRDAGPEQLPGQSLTVEIGRGRRTRLSLATLQASSTADGGTPTQDWDIAFEGWNVFTNSGPSGSGRGAAFGPLDELAFLFDTVPQVPFLREDVTGGAFLNWYTYDSDTHQLWSRYHTYGVKRDEQWFKVQVLSYYGEVENAPVSALYNLRYAEVSEEGSTETSVIQGLDGTAGYPKVVDEAASGCVNLRTGERLALTPSAARKSKEWDLCFRRDVISVNGEAGGPGGVVAVDLDADSERSSTEVKERTADNQREDFEAVDFEHLTDPSRRYRGDHVLSAFGEAWITRRGSRVEPREGAWLVRGGDGEAHYLLLVTDVAGDEESASQVTLRVRTLR